MRRAQIFSPRRQTVVIDGIHESETIASLRARVRQLLNCSGQNDALLLHGQVLKDEDTAGSSFENEEEVLFYTEVSAPAVIEPSSGRIRSAQGGPVKAAAQVQPGAARTITAADLSSLFQARPGQAGGAGRPQQAAAQPVARRSQPDGAAPSGGARQPSVPQHLLRELVEMGFEERKARAALLRNNNDIEIAVDWLSENWDKPDSFYSDSNPVPSAPTMAPAAVSAPSRPHFEPSPEVKKYAEIFDPVLRAVALVASGDSRTNRAALEGVRLPAMEKDGWRNLTSAVRRIWQGERDDAALTAQLDANTSFLVRRILDLIRSGNVGAGQLDFYVRHAIPKDPQVEATTLAPLRPWVQRIARMAKRQTAQTFGEVDAPPSAEDQLEDENIARFVTTLDSRGWQLRGPLEMLCAGVRSDTDVLECIAALPNGLPDDNSARLVHAIMEELEHLG